MLASLARLLDPPTEPPAHLAARFRELGPEQDRTLRAALSAHIEPRHGAAGSEAARREIEDHRSVRLERDRHLFVPWLDDARPLDGAAVLEIGCGTGGSSVALAEQGARVTAVDIDQAAIHVARERTRIYGLEVEFVNANATEIAGKLGDPPFDFVLFYASLEHMTHLERIDAMRSTWDMLRPGALWCVADTPNRLWAFDQHTSRLPFFLWLPNDLAFAYSSRSPRVGFRELYRESDEAAELHFLRRGRGVSYHEFDLALGPAERLRVVSSMRLFHRQRRRFDRLRRWRHRHELAPRWEGVLAELRPDLHPGFFQKSLDLILRK